MNVTSHGECILDEIQQTNLDIRLGFDEGYKGYWLTVEDSDCPAVELNKNVERSPYL